MPRSTTPGKCDPFITMLLRRFTLTTGYESTPFVWQLYASAYCLRAIQARGEEFLLLKKMVSAVQLEYCDR